MENEQQCAHPPSIYDAIISKMCVTPRNWNWVWACPRVYDTSKCYLNVVKRGVPSDLSAKCVIYRGKLGLGMVRYGNGCRSVPGKMNNENVEKCARPN